jgi:hypothetical protein
VTRLRIAGLALLAGAALTLALHAAGAPEDLYRWAYHHLLGGLDVPEDPSQGTVDAVSLTSLIGGILEAVAGVALLVVDAKRSARAAGRP